MALLQGRATFASCQQLTGSKCPAALYPKHTQATNMGRRLTARMAATDTEPSTQQAEAGPASQQQLKYIGPPPQRFSVADGQLSEIAGASAPFATRLGSGALTLGYSIGIAKDDGSYGVVKASGWKLQETSKVLQLKRPAKPLQLYEFESCPFCKKVREAISMLDLDVLVYPCPKEGLVWRPKAIELGGKKQFPYLVDPNTGKSMYESDAIVKYLFEEYGDGQVPLLLGLGQLTTVTCALGLAPRSKRGHSARKSKLPDELLVLYGYEASPFVKVVREVLCELQLPYLLRTTARGSPKRQEVFKKRGHFQVPYLEDPNQGVCLFESSAIVKYLEDTYALTV